MEEVTNRQIIAYARSCRTTISAPQLARWRELGLLGPYRRRGRGRGKGQTVYYRRGAKRLAVLIARGLRKTRKFDVMGWNLWLNGYPLTSFVRNLLCRKVDGWEAYVSHEVGFGDERARARATRQQSPSAKAAYQQWELQLPLLRRLAQGLQPQFGDVVKYLQSQGKVMPTDWQSTVRQWEGTGTAIRLDRLRLSIEGASDAELNQLRDDMLVAWYALAEHLVSLPVRLFLPPHDPEMLLAWLALARIGSDTGFPCADFCRGALVKVLRMKSVPPQLEVLQRLLRYWHKEIRRERRDAQLL